MAKVSTLNKKLPKASSIRWCTGAGKSMSTSISTDENRKFSRKIGFKQGGSTKSAVTWQIVYRWRNRYTPSVSKTKKNATWSGWSSWRTPTNCSLYGSDGKKKTYTKGAAVPDRKYWRVGNRAYVKTSSYNVFAHWDTANSAAKTMSKDYDAIEYQFAIRSYHAKTAKHGEWVYQKLKVYRRATVADEVLIRNANGLHIDFNYICERGGNVSITSIKDANGFDILKSDVKVAPATDTKRLSSGNLTWYAYKRSGYTAGQVLISADNLKRSPEFHEKLTVTGNYVTKDNAKTAFKFKNSGYVYGEATSDEVPRPRITVSLDKNTGVVTVKAYKNEEFDGNYGGVKLLDIQCSANYTLDGVSKSVSAFSTTKLEAADIMLPYGSGDTGGGTTDELLGTWKYRPPMNVEVTYLVSVKNELGQFGTAILGVNKKTNTFKSAGYLLNSITYSNVYAAVTYNAQFNMSTEKDCVINLPYGRSLPFAVYGTGRTPSMTLQGYAIDNEKKINKYSTPYYLKRLAQYLGVYLLRNSQGEIFKVAVKKVDIQYVRSDLISVTLEMQEVS